ncbi:MAG TPA: glycosyltransferase family 4 protein [Candidatus Methylomirabilis sp.]|nr:glycosyltransferase family 4 protein [Candidatus Methylomirabilis sp.]
MRLGFYTYSFLPTAGGAEILLHGLADSLAERGHEVTIWAPRVRGQENRIAARYRLRRYGRPSSKRFGVRQTLPRLLVETWGRRPDVLHCHGAYPAGFVGAAFKRLTGTPMVIRPHGADILPGEWIDRDRRLAARMRRALLTADAVVAQGGFLAERLSALGVQEERLHLIHNGVRLPEPSSTPVPDEPRVLAMGSLTPKKGFDILLQAFHLVRQRAPEARLTIAGDGPERARLVGLTDSLGLSEAVTLPGLVTGDAKTALLTQASVFVSSSRREPFANANLEAMAQGRAIVATRVGGNLEMVEDERTGLLVEPEDPDGLAKAILRLLEDPRRAEVLGRAARRKAEAFSWDGMMDRYEALYREVARRAGRSRVGAS